ncbi:YaiI/YqxD family protein [Marinobacteraceae bacterium S3BR75-40.1]
MQIWVDADACPNVIKTILFKAAQRVQVPMTLVANQPISTPASKLITARQVPSGFDAADDWIVEQVQPGDLVITSDIPLASEVIEKGGQALSPRGELFTPDNVRSRLNIRDFMDTMRSSGIQTGGPSAMGQKERQAFSNHLDRILARRPR